MKVKLGDEDVTEEVIDETTELPNGDGGDQPIVDETPNDNEARIRELEIEKARLEGQNSVLSRAPVAPAQADHLKNYKQVVWTDVNALSDEEFETKHKMPKYKATAAISEAEIDQNRRELTETRVEARLAAKYGKDYLEVKSEVDEMIKDASPEVRQDPERLAKFAERCLQAAIKSKPAEVIVTKGAPVNRSKITSGFDKPNAGGQPKAKENLTDEIDPSYRTIGRAFGLNSEKERKELMANDYVPMELGAGVSFRDPDKGFEKAKSA